MDVERPCSWMLRLPSATLQCAAHDVDTYPWFPAEGCELPVAQVCHVCVRAVVPIASRFFWYLLCPRCRSIEAHLARPLGQQSMTPLDGHAGNGRSSVYGRERFPASALASARAYQEYVERLHPWIETVEPRVTDVEWLAGLIGQG